jgi:hypothetical protein
MPAPTETGRMTPPPALSPELAFVNGRERRVALLDHVPFTIGRQLDRDLVVIDARASCNRKGSRIRAASREHRPGNVCEWGED